MDREHLLELKDSLVFNCKLCGGEEYVAEKKCKGSELFRTAVILSNSGVRNEYLLPSYDEINKNIAFASEIKHFTDNLQRSFDIRLSLLFLGGNRSGKTYVAAFIASKAVEIGKTINFVSADELLKNWDKFCSLDKASKYNNDKEDFLASFEYNYYDVDLLIIDDLGREIAANYVSWTSFLRAILKRRLENNKLTLITSSINGEEFLQQKYGKSFANILKHNFKTFSFKGLEVDSTAEEKWNSI